MPGSCLVPVLLLDYRTLFPKLCHTAHCELWPLLSSYVPKQMTTAGYYEFLNSGSGKQNKPLGRDLPGIRMLFSVHMWHYSNCSVAGVLVQWQCASPAHPIPGMTFSTTINRYRNKTVCTVFQLQGVQKKGVAYPPQTVHYVNTKLWFLMPLVVLDENETWAPVDKLLKKD